MKIGLASLHPRQLSGQIESLIALARALEQQGCEVRLASAFDADALRQGQRLGSAREAGATPGGKVVSMARALGRAAALAPSVDLLHLSLPTPAFSWVVDLLGARLGRRPLVVSYEAHLADVELLLRDGGLWRDPAFYLPLALVNNGLWGRCSRYQADRYLVASEWQRGELLALGASEARVVSLPNLIDWHKLKRASRAEARARLFGELGARPIVGWAGHFHDVKGVDLLLEAFGRLRRSRPEARLALAWSGIGNPGRVRARLAALDLGPSVIGLGRVEMGEFLAAVDLLALPYRGTLGQGAFPNLVVEAMAVGVPLVTSDLPLLRELVGERQTALLTPAGQVEPLAAAIERLLAAPALGQAMRERQRAVVQAELATEPLAHCYLALYQRVLAERRQETPSTPLP